MKKAIKGFYRIWLMVWLDIPKETTHLHTEATLLRPDILQLGIRHLDMNLEAIPRRAIHLQEGTLHRAIHLQEVTLNRATLQLATLVHQPLTMEGTDLVVCLEC